MILRPGGEALLPLHDIRRPRVGRLDSIASLQEGVFKRKSIQIWKKCGTVDSL